jgi:hypothetical protein
VEPVTERAALTQASSQAMTRVGRGMVLLVMLVPLLLLGGVLAAIFHGTAELLVVEIMATVGGVSALAGFTLLVVGLVGHTRAQRKLHALDHGPLPRARVVR